ncbi:MAG: class I SAM-dependent methyltransferase [Pararhodobacter sp.]
MSADPETLAVYEARAADYARLVEADGPGGALRAFIAALPKGGRVLDLGCGAGGASAQMAAAGLVPDPVDAAQAMVDLARAKGLPARRGTFDDLNAEAEYDGVWASFSLLHAPRAAMPGHLSAIHRALKPGGLLHIGVKLGTGEGRDALGRFYTYYEADELRGLVQDAGLVVTSERQTLDRGLAGTIAAGILLLARKEATDA